MKNKLRNKNKVAQLFYLFTFMVLSANTAVAQTAQANQDTFIWNGATSTDWDVSTNWTVLRATSTPGTDTYPGQTGGDTIHDIVFVNKNDTPNALILNGQSRTVIRLTISNQFGTESGSIMTISNGATLEIASNQSNNLVLAGGNLVNNGALVIRSVGVGFTNFPVYGINCSNPFVLPTVAREYSYSGSGTLSITLSVANFANAAAFATSGNSADTNLANATYKLTLNNPAITLNQSTTLAIGAIRTIGATTALPVTPKLIISGLGLTLGTAGTPSIGSLIAVGNATNVTVDTGTVLALNSATANVNSGLEVSNSIAGAGDAVTGTNRTRFTNNGTINIQGNTSANGIRVATFSALNNPIVGITFVNNGVIDVNVNATLTATANSTPAAFQIPNGFGSSNTNALLTLTNNGTINLKNTSTATGHGSAIWVTGAGERTKTTFTNSATGILNIDGTTSNSGPSFTLHNNGLVNSNSSFNSFVAFNNNSGASMNFTSSSTQINALVSPTTNIGTINTGAASELSVVSGVSAASTGVVDPGGALRRGIADFSKASTLAVNSTFRLQVSGNAVAGVDFDRITNSAAGGGFNIANAKLDVTSIYIPTVDTTIDIITTNATGTLTGSNFNQIVTPLPSGWAVNIITGVSGSGKVQLVYTTGTSWNGTAWSNGVPTLTKDAVIAANYGTGNGVLNVKNLTVNTGVRLTVNQGSNGATISESIINNGFIVVENNANLIQTAAGADTNISADNAMVLTHRNSNLLKRLDYTLWSAPVSGNKTLADFSSLTTPLRNYVYNPSTNFYNSVGNTGTFSIGKAYLIRMPDAQPGNPVNTTDYYKGLTAITYEGAFWGKTLNNGTFTIATTANTFNAVGNPYPSTISANAFLSANNTDGTLYFWRKTNGVAGTSYATYNATMGGVANGGFAAPNGTIQVAQGFIVKATGTSLAFNNSMRATPSSSAQFFKTKSQAEKSRIWLNLNDADGMINQTLLGYLDGATTGVDKGIDGKSFGDAAIELVSSIDGESYTIQGRPAFDATDVVALNFKTNVAGTYTIAIDHVDGLFLNGQNIYLVDKTTGTTTNLSEGAYSFTAAAGVDNTRFTLAYQKTLKVDVPLFNENSVLVSRNNGTLNVKSSAIAINNVKVYDVQGRLVAERKNVKSNTATFSNLKANQVLIVKVTADNNSVVTKKVIN